MEVDLLSLDIEVDIRCLSCVDDKSVGLEQPLRIDVITLLGIDTMDSGIGSEIDGNFLASLVFETSSRNAETIILEVKSDVRDNCTLGLYETFRSIAISEHNIDTSSDGYVLETFYISNLLSNRLDGPCERLNEKQKNYGKIKSYGISVLEMSCLPRIFRLLSIIFITSLYSLLSKKESGNK